MTKELASRKLHEAYPETSESVFFGWLAGFTSAELGGHTLETLCELWDEQRASVK